MFPYVFMDIFEEYFVAMILKISKTAFFIKKSISIVDTKSV